MEANKEGQYDPRKLLFDNEILTTQELAGLLGKKPKTIQNMVSKREIPFTRAGGTTIFLKASIMDWLKRNEVKPWQ